MSIVTCISDDDASFISAEDERILDPPVPPQSLIPPPNCSAQDQFLMRYYVQPIEREDLLIPYDEVRDGSLRAGSVGICCRFCAMAPTYSVDPGSFIFPKDFSEEELVDRIEEVFKPHCKNCPNAPFPVALAFNSIEDGDSPNNSWVEAMLAADIISIDVVEETNDGAYVPFKSLVFCPEKYGYVFYD